MLDNFPAPWQKKLSSMAGNSGNVPAPEPAESDILVLHPNESDSSLLDKTVAEICEAYDSEKFIIYMYTYSDSGFENTATWLLGRIGNDNDEAYVFEFFSLNELVYKYFLASNSDDYPYLD